MITSDTTRAAPMSRDTLASQTFRDRRLRQALVSSVTSKALGMAAQVVSLSLVAHALGTSRFAAYLAVTASVAWASMLGFGFVPALTARLARAAARHDRTEEVALVSAGIWIALAAGGVLMLLAGIIAMWGTDEFITIISAASSPREVRAGIFASLFIVAVHFLSSASTAIRAGYQESHITNSLAVVANVAVIVGAWAVSIERAGIATFIWAIYAPFTFVFLLDLVRILNARRYLWPLATPAAAFGADHAARGLLGLCRTTFAIQLFSFLTNSGLVILVSHLERATATAEFGALMRLSVLATSVVSLVSTSLLPAVSDAAARAQMRSVARYYRRAVMLTLGLGGSICGALAVAGPQIFAAWLGAVVAPPGAVCMIFGLYLIVAMSNSLHFSFAIALGGLRHVGSLLLGQAALACGLAIVLAPRLGNAGVGLALLVSALTFGGWILPRAVRSHFAD